MRQLEDRMLLAAVTQQFFKKHNWERVNKTKIKLNEPLIIKKTKTDIIYIQHRIYKIPSLFKFINCHIYVLFW